MKYTLTYIHCIIYIISLYISHKYLILNYSIFSILFGWALFGLSTIGHDCIHNSFSSNILVNKIVGFMCLDCFLITSKDWDKIHHVTLKSENDKMQLYGNNIISSIFYTARGLTYNVNKRGKSIIKHVVNIPFYYILYNYNYLSIIGIFITYFWCIGYLTYITHSYSKLSLNNNMTSKEYILDNTWDIFPKSHVANLLTGGINIHAAHHLYPNKTKYEYMQLCEELQKHSNYRRIDTLFTGKHSLLSLIINRNNNYV